MTPAGQVHEFLADIIAAARKAREFMGDVSLEEFSADDRTVYAVIRALEILGEATKRIPPDCREKYPRIPWKLMAGIRDKLIHDYVNVNLEVDWRTVNDDLPVVIPELERTLAAETPQAEI